MEWIKITDELPINGSIVYAKTASQSQGFLCKFKNDSFGLGDHDFKVIEWRYLYPMGKNAEDFHRWHQGYMLRSQV